MKTKPLYISLTIIAFVSLFTACKKYPENTLWFTKPEKLLGYCNLRAFTVDGVDSMPMWNRIYNTPPYNGYFTPSVGSSYDIKNAVFNFKDPSENEFRSDFGYGSYHFFDHKKQLYIFSYMDVRPNHPAPTYNIFYTAESNWKILKLTKDGSLRIKRTYNNKIYEMEFN